MQVGKTRQRMPIRHLLQIKPCLADQISSCHKIVNLLSNVDWISHQKRFDILLVCKIHLHMTDGVMIRYMPYNLSRRLRLNLDVRAQDLAQ